MNPRFLFALCASLALPPSSARADVTPAQAARALSGFEKEVTEARVRALGPGWEGALQALLADPSTKPVLRPRVIAGLSFARTPGVAVTLRAVLKLQGAAAQGAAVIETREALRALAAVEGVRALRDVRPFLDHPRAELRIAAADGLAQLGGGEAREALRARHAIEREAPVVEALRSALIRVER